MPTYYKFLNADGSTLHGFGKWPLPQGGKPGEWLPKLTGKLIPCVHGYHILQAADLIHWLTGPVLVEVESKGRAVRDGNKSVVRQARTLRVVEGWNERNQRLVAADWAEHVLPIFEAVYPDDKRPHKVIAAVRDFANGKITREQLNAASDAVYAVSAAASFAASAAAYAASAYAASAAASDAAYAVSAAAYAVSAAACAAARAAASYAASAAAYAARDAEREWQTARLMEYLVLPRDGGL